MKTTSITLAAILLTLHAHGTAIVLSDNRSVSWELDGNIGGSVFNFADSQSASFGQSFNGSVDVKGNSWKTPTTQKSVANGDLFATDQTAAASFELGGITGVDVHLVSKAVYDVTFFLPEQHLFELRWSALPRSSVDGVFSPLLNEHAKITGPGGVTLWDGSHDQGTGNGFRVFEGTLQPGTYHLFSETITDLTGHVEGPFGHDIGAASLRSQFELALRVPEPGSVLPLAGLAIGSLAWMSRKVRHQTSTKEETAQKAQ